ncbi:MAG: peptidoglycan DD-metalloendopeptidase family protein [Cyanobium sp.]
MKPYRWILTAIACSAASVPLVGIATEERGRSASSDLLLSSLNQSPDTIWVPVRQTVSIEELSQQLSEDESNLARLNATNEDHHFQPGEWLVLPSGKSDQAQRVAALDGSGLRIRPRTEDTTVASAVGPLMGTVRIGDNLRSLAKRYGLSPSDLLRFNPELNTSTLVVGSLVRLTSAGTQQRPRTVIATNPTGSGGASYPNTPDFGPEQPGFQSGNITWIWPARGEFTSGYGWRWGRMHKGIDVANNVGTPIVAAASGRVTYAGWHDGGYGYLVEITHPDGSISLYGHNSRILVSVGETVEQGHTISQMGSTGRSTGPHLHFEIHSPGRGAINPLRFLPPRA